MIRAWLLYVFYNIVFEFAFLQAKVDVFCPTGWTANGGKCYKAYSRKLSWHGSLKICQQDGALLATVKDHFVNDFVSSLAEDALTNDFWIGLSNVSANSADWNDGTTWSVPHGFWANGQPNTEHGSCVFVTKSGALSSWSVSPCQHKRSFVCQYLACNTDNFRCLSGECIASIRDCDGQTDCMDGSDEIACPNRFCVNYVQETSGEISLSPFPNPIEANEDCKWTLEGPIGSVIELQFLEFKMNDGYEVIVMGGAKTEQSSWTLLRLSDVAGNSSFRLTSPNNLMIVRFISNGNRRLNNFRASWRAVQTSSPDSGVILEAKSFFQSLSQEFYPDFYLSNQEIIFIIRSDKARDIIHLQLEELDLTEGDHITLRDGDSESAPVLGQFKEISSVKEQVFSTGPIMYIRFKTNEQVMNYRRGFLFYYKTGCVVEMISPTGELASPGYPDVNYAHFQNCQWTISSPLRDSITLHFMGDVFGIDPSDSLEVSEMKDSQNSPSLLFTHSGSQVPKDIHISSGKALISFSTSALDNAQGFMVQYSIGCPDPLFNMDTIVTPQVTSFPYRIKLNVSCPDGYVFSSEEFYDSGVVSQSLSQVEMECLFGGSWNFVNTPQCVAKYCGVPPSIMQGYLVSSNGTQYQSIANYACIRGYELSGQPDVLCDENGNWGKPPTCSVLRCPKLPVPSNKIPSSKIIHKDGTASGSIVSFSCPAGYEIDGSPILLCQDDGTWDYSVPTCSALLCLVPNIENGVIRGNPLTAKVSNSLIVECNEGYVINGTKSVSTSITCLEDQTVGVVPFCEVSGFDYCFANNCSVNETCISEIGAFTCLCKNGYFVSEGLCLDIDECSDDTDGCDQICENTEGGYECSCKAGYSLYTSNGTNNFFIAPGETGLRQGDVYHVDHTCVLNLCPKPADIQNGYISNPKSDYYVGYRLDIGCELGFVPKDGISSAFCDNSSSWLPIVPSCEDAKCPSDVLPTLTNAPIKIISNDPILYGDLITLICDVDGQPIFNKTRTCEYNPSKLMYELQGDDYECGVIDCGPPETFLPEGASAFFPKGRSTTFNSSFLFACKFPYFQSSVSASISVTCQANGQWDLGDLDCVYGACPYPGQPLGGQAVIEGYDYEDIASFTCDRSGFGPVPDITLACINSKKGEGLAWNGSTPACIDQEEPFFIGCPTNTKFVKRYDSVGVTAPIALDNSGGIREIRVSPEYFLENQPLAEDTTVIYTAYDHEGLNGSCSLRLQVIDESPPSIECPPPVIITINGSESVTYFFNDSLIKANDDKGISSIVLSISNVTVGAQDIGKAFDIKATVFDTTGNSDLCLFQLYVADEKCSERIIKTPPNTIRSCSATISGGIRCEFSCVPGFYFYDSYPNEVFVSTCEPGQDFEPLDIPSCTDTAPLSSATRVYLSYGAVSNEEIFDNCTELIKTEVETFVSGIRVQLSTLCLTQQDIVNVQLKEGSVNFNYIKFSKEAAVVFQIEMLPDGLNQDQYGNCSAIIEAEVAKILENNGIFQSLRNISIDFCPEVTISFQSAKQVFQCENSKARNLNGENICVKCPPGTSLAPDGSCELCPVGTYWVASPNIFILSQCALCPPGLSTQSAGSTGFEYCVASCIGNFVSANGVPPCEECTNNTYRYNSTYCKACPDKTKALRMENPLFNNCTATCTYTRIPSIEILSERRATYGLSVDGCKRTCEEWELLNPGSQCIGFNYGTQDSACIIYDSFGNRAINDDLDFYDRKCGNDNLEACYCAPECAAGFYSEDGFGPDCKQCPAGFTSSPGSILCSECASNETSVPGTGICFDAVKTLCLLGTCQNGSVCRVENHDFYCECPKGYSGRQCDTVVDSCASSPCYFNGNCTNISGGEYECQCPPGTNGSRCENNINDCQTNTCNGRGTCIDGLDSFACLCVDGFDGDQCQIRKTQACDRIACDPVGTLSCDPVNDVYAVCTCKEGYKGPTCALDIDSCRSSPCRNGGTCIDTVDGFSCICQLGFQGDRCETPDYICSNLPCKNSLSCENDYRTGIPMCICEDGYDQGSDCSYDLQTGYIEGQIALENNSSLKFCQFICNFRDRACAGLSFEAISDLSNNDRGICKLYSTIERIVTDIPTDIIASRKSCKYHTADIFYTSWLKTNYFVNGFDVLMRDVVNEFRELVCEGNQPIDAECRVADSDQQLPESVSCGAFGVQCIPDANFSCSGVEVQFACARSRVYFGEECRRKDICLELNPCERGLCVNDASRPELYRCECPPAYEGAQCQHEINECLTADDAVSCKNNATCIDEFLGFSCQCQAGFTGAQCERDINECLKADCDGLGTQSCIDGINGFTCLCLPGYTGQKCNDDIDDCLSQPCYHGGTCLDKINGYECNCSAGWTGPQCDITLDQCQGDPCENQAACFPVFKTFHCECSSNNFGTFCENAEDICTNANPCYNGGSCSNNGESCSCPSGYQNEGCYLSDFVGCSDIKCENGGSCVSEDTSFARCSCPNEYTGSSCEMHVNQCDVTTCFPEATCIDGISEAFCRCPVGKTGPACSQDIDDDFDVCLRASDSPSGVGLSFPAPYNDTGGFTLKFWIKFSQPGSSGHILTMSYSSSGYLHDESIPILTLNDAGLILGRYATLPFRYKPVNDGNWHYVIVTWEKSTGHVDLILDFVRSGQVDGYAQGAMLSGGGLEVDIGEKKTQSFEKLSYFVGCVSRLEILKKAIDFNSQGEFATLSRLEGDVVRWGEFSPFGNADIVRPSTASISDCRGNGIGPECVLPRDVMAPNILYCPDDIIITTIYDRAQVIWTEPSFDGAAIISSSDQPGTYFDLGVHTVLYTGRDGENNTAVCDFKVFVNSDNCSSLEPPRGGGTQKCYESSPLESFSSCTIDCPSSDATLVEDTPSIFSCGPSGTWKSTTLSDDLYPTCGKIVTKAAKSMMVTLRYSINFTDCTSITAAMNNREILDDLIKFRQRWGPSVCSDSNCNGVPLSVNCDDLPDTVVQFNLSNVNSVLSNGWESYPAEDALSLEIFDNGLFDVSDIFVSSKIDSRQFQIDVTLLCDGNQILRGDQCVKCGPGTFVDVNKRECKNCPIGTFQDQYGQNQCVNCSVGNTTQRVGSEDASLCKESCQAGQFFSTEVNECIPCGIGFYQDMAGQFECKPCAVGQVTGQKGSVSIQSCSDGCSSGEQLLPSGVCAPCLQGTYREFGLDGVCTPCPGGYTSPGTGNVNKANCSILKCPAGSRADADNKVCEPCGKGQYQPDVNQDNCLTCPENFTTEFTGTVLQSSCVRYCPSGQELNGTSCVECDIAFYKSNDDGLLGKCQPCSIGYLTNGTGASSAKECNIRNCAAGYKVRSFGSVELCFPCQYGEYQPERYQSSCIKCPEQTYTRRLGAINASDCESFCDPGSELDANNTCQPCPRGYYKTNDKDRFSSCQICPDANFITNDTGSTSVNECIIANCSAGSFRTDKNTCELCPVGYYQIQKWQTGCISCPPDYTTNSTGSISEEDCFLNCPVGKEDVNGTCVDCSIGFYKEVAGVQSCTKCQPDFITSQAGSSSVVDCNIRACSGGNYRNASSNKCFPCPYGQYQPQQWQDSCLPCQNGFTTFTLGAQTENECLVDCPVGTEYSFTSTSCDQCPRGTYRDKSDLSQTACVLCPSEFITLEEGSSDISDCTVRNCSVPGEFRNAQTNLCEVCGLGTYNSIKWRESCTSCPSGFTTKELGRKLLDDCFRDCPSGQAVNENTNVCENCGLGFFRNKSQSWTCQPCPNDLLTSSSQATSESECTVSKCLQGQSYNSTTLQCEACPLDTYQPEPNQLTCLDCPGSLLTLQSGADALSDCVSRCTAGLLTCQQYAACQDSNDGESECVCIENYVGNADNCTHVCDTSESYCKNGGICSKTSSPPCTCQEPYSGDTCQAVIAEDLSDDSQSVIVGTSIGGVILLLLLLLLLVFIIIKLRRKSSSKDPKGSELESSYSGSVSNQPSSRMILRANTLGHPAFSNSFRNASSDPSVYIPKKGGAEANVAHTTFYYDNNSFVST